MSERMLVDAIDLRDEQIANLGAEGIAVRP